MSYKKSQYSFELIGMIGIFVIVAIVFMSIFYKDSPKDKNEMELARQSVEDIASYGQRVASMGDGNRIKVGIEVPVSATNVTFGTGYIQIAVETTKGVFDFTKNSGQHFIGYNFTSNGNIMNGVQDVYFEVINDSICIYPPSMRENYCCGLLYKLPRFKNMGSSYSYANITCDFGSQTDQPCNTQLNAATTLTAISVRCIDSHNAGVEGSVNFFMYNDSLSSSPMINATSTNFSSDGKFTYALSSSMLITSGHTYTINATCYDACYEEVTPNTLLKNSTQITKSN